jgi:uncharacterized protein (TIGR00369 family)
VTGSPGQADPPLWTEPPPGGSWADRSVLGLGHLERANAARQGRLPISPMTYLTEMAYDEASDGHATFSIPASPWFANGAGLIPGGMLGPVADAGLGASVGTKLGPGVLFTTAELSLTFISPLRPAPDTRVSASGQAIHVGRSIGVSEAFLIADPGDRLIAHGTTRCAIFPPLDPVPEPPQDLPVLEQEIPGGEEHHPLRRPVRGEPLPPEVFEKHSGLEVMRGWIDGDLPLPPLYHLTGLRPVSVAEGRAEQALPCSAWLASPAGTVQGGFTAMIAEAALAAAAFSTAEAGTAIATLDLKVNYLRPVFPDGKELLARARVLHRGRSLAVSGAELVKDGKTVALATGSAMFLPGRPPDLAGVEFPAGDPEEGGGES